MMAKKVNKLNTYVVWLANNTSRQDDDWIKIVACSEQDAISKTKFNKHKFCISRVFTLAEFNKIYGI